MNPGIALIQLISEQAMPSLYVDTQERRFWDGETGDFSPLAAALGDFDAAARKLRVDLVAFSNGVTRTPLHVGAGASVGAIDQPIQRERHPSRRVPRPL